MDINKHTIQLTSYEYSILKKNFLIAMTCEKYLESATIVEQDNEEFVELSLTGDELEDLTGYVAAESNHARTESQREDLNSICDYFESCLDEIRRRQ